MSILIRDSWIRFSISLLAVDIWFSSQSLKALRIDNEFPKSLKKFFIVDIFEKLVDTILSNAHSS